MKRIIALLITLVLVFALASCASVKIEKVDGTETEKQTETEIQTETEALTETESETEEIFTQPETDDEIENLLEDEPYVFNGLMIYAPKGFTETVQNGVTLLVPPDYPVHTDNISFTVTSQSADAFDEITADDLYDQLSEIADISDYDCEKDYYNDVPYIFATYDLTLEGVTMSQLNFTAFFEDYSTTIVYTIVNEEYSDPLISSFYTLDLAD